MMALKVTGNKESYYVGLNAWAQANMTTGNGTFQSANSESNIA